MHQQRGESFIHSCLLRLLAMLLYLGSSFCENATQLFATHTPPRTHNSQSCLLISHSAVMLCLGPPLPLVQFSLVVTCIYVQQVFVFFFNLFLPFLSFSYMLFCVYCGQRMTVHQVVDIVHISSLMLSHRFHRIQFFVRDGKDQPLSPLACTARTRAQSSSYVASITKLYNHVQ